MPLKVDSMKKSLVLFFTFACIFTASANAQTRRRTPAPRRSTAARRAATPPRVARRVPVAPCPASSATTTPSGLTVMVTRKGTGQPVKVGDTVQVHYTGLLTDGTKFDSSRDRGQPIAFKLGAGRVIKGWDEGVARLRVGDQATLIIPSELGYGERGAGGGEIPPGATLVFVIEVVEATAEPASAPEGE